MATTRRVFSVDFSGNHTLSLMKYSKTRIWLAVIAALPEIYFRFCFWLSIYRPHGCPYARCTTCSTVRHTHNACSAQQFNYGLWTGAQHTCCCKKRDQNFNSTASTWLGDNKINCHAIVQPIFMKFTGIVGYGSPHNII